MKFFGTRPTYQIFAVVTLVTGVMYFVFNATYLKKRPQLEGNDIVKKKPKTINMQTLEDKHANDIGLEEKPRNPEQVEVKGKGDALTTGNDGIDNAGFLKEKAQNRESETNERDASQIEAMKNAKNVDTSKRQDPAEQREDRSMTKKSGDDKSEESSARDDGSFSNPTFETDNSDQCEITMESQRIDDERVDRPGS